MGCFAAGFLILEILGLRLTNFCAVALNVLIGLAAIAIPDPAPGENEPAVKPSKRSTPEPVTPAKWLLTIAFVNGLAALVCEVVWFRYLAFTILERPAYAFPAILCVYLLGIGLGSLCYSLLAGRIKPLPRALGNKATTPRLSAGSNKPSNFVPPQSARVCTWPTSSVKGAEPRKPLPRCSSS